MSTIHSLLTPDDWAQVYADAAHPNVYNHARQSFPVNTQKWFVEYSAGNGVAIAREEFTSHHVYRLFVAHCRRTRELVAYGPVSQFGSISVAA